MENIFLFIKAYLVDRTVPFFCEAFLYMWMIYFVYGVSFVRKGVKSKRTGEILAGVVFFALFFSFIYFHMVSVAAERIFLRR